MRCGCNDEAIVVTDGPGIDVAESKRQNVTTYTVSFNGAEVAGPGTMWDPNTGKYQVKLAAADPGLAFDGTGAIYNTAQGSGPGPTPSSTGATVKALEDREQFQNVVAGIWGCGYLIKPYCTRASIEYGAQRGMDALHLPVRFLSDGTPVVYPNETVMGTEIIGAHVQEQDIQRWRILSNETGVWYPVPNKQPSDPQDGSFGYLEKNEVGLLPLAEAFEVVRTSCVLILELQFPGFDRTTWSWGHPTPQARIDRFLDRVKVLIQRYGLQQSVVVMSNTPDVPDGKGTSRPVLDGFTNAGIRAGALLLQQADMDNYPASTWPSQWSWSIINETLPTEDIKAYTDKGIHTLLAIVNRQYQQGTRVVPAGALGVTSADPEYYAGQFGDHPTAANYAYRKTSSTWEFNTIDNGLYPPNDLDPSQTGPNKRGLHLRGSTGWWTDKATAFNQGAGVPYFVLHGYLCPLDKFYSSYTIDFMLDPGSIPSPGYACVAFGVTTDHPYANLTNSPPDNSGYVVTYTGGTTNRVLAIHSYDPASGGLVERASVNATGADMSLKRFQIYVTPDDLRVRFVNRDTGAIVAEIPDGAVQPWQTDWRGGYVFLGQYSQNAPDRSATFHEVKLTNTAPLRDGDDGGWIGRASMRA